MTTRVSFKSKSGSEVSGELQEPPGTGTAGAIVLIQEYWGVNEHIKELVERFARDGFLVVAPDLYHGKITKDPTEAAKLMTELDTATAVQEIAGAAAFLRAHPRSNGKVGVTGFCLGGALAFASACHVEGLAGVAAFYGVPPAEKVDYNKVTAPVLAHFATRDQWASADKAEAIKSQIEANGGSMELHVYNADHAFMNTTRPEVHDPTSAKMAWDRTIAFFKKHLD